MMIYLVRHGKTTTRSEAGGAVTDYHQAESNRSAQLFYQRVKAAWSDLKNRISEQAEKNVLLVTHGGVIEAILCLEHGIPFSNRTKHFSTPSAKLIPLEIL